jgi:hypothetical protein
MNRLEPIIPGESIAGIKLHQGINDIQEILEEYATAETERELRGLYWVHYKIGDTANLLYDIRKQSIVLIETGSNYSGYIEGLSIKVGTTCKQMLDSGYRIFWVDEEDTYYLEGTPGVAINMEYPELIMHERLDNRVSSIVVYPISKHE